MNLAPIVIFVYNRLEHTKKTISALQNNLLSVESDLIVYSDASKNEKSSTGVREVREYLKSVSGFKSIKIFERSENLGLSKSIISGVTETVNQYGKIIVLEDDLVTSPYFLKYMNEALGMYEHEEKVISIHAYVYPVKDKLPETFFLRGADCWGWATWKRGWDLFEPDGQKLLNKLKSEKITREFDFGNSYPYTLMLKYQINGFNSSWAIRWNASAFLADRLTLYPGKSLVRNIGLDDSGTHTGKSSFLNVELSQTEINLKEIPIEENIIARKSFRDFFLSFRMMMIKASMILNYYYKIIKKYYDFYR